VQVIFTLFDLEASSGCIYDWLKIYDGTSTSDSLLGTWCGTDSPDTVVAYRSSGALTFRFYADSYVTAQGWVANIQCVETPDLPPPPPPEYCDAGSNQCDEYIARVQLNTIDNSTSCTSGGYADYTAISTKLSPGTIYPITVTNGSDSYPSDQCGIWIDWNQDYDFSDDGEQISVNGSPGRGPYTANIIPPDSALKGYTRMRIRIMWTGTLSSCGNASYGEVEDYNIYVGTPGLWVGGENGAESDWNSAGNWDDGRVPSGTTNVIIPENSQYFPVISGTQSCQDLEISDGTTVTVNSGATFSIDGDLIIGDGSSGVLVIDGGTCNVSGSTTAMPGSNISIINGGGMNDNE
jgi:hypothetical protein